MRELIEAAKAEPAKMKILRFARIKDFDNPEYFLVKRGDTYYALHFAAASGITFEIIAQSKSKSAVNNEYDLAVENKMKGTGARTGTLVGLAHGVEVATTKVDATARKHLAAFDHPMFGVDWGGGKEAAPDIETLAQDEFYDILTTQVRKWKGTGHALSITKHRYWPTFKKMMEAAIKKKYGSRIKLYRGIHGKQAEQLMKGADLDLHPYSSWTPSLELAKEFRSASGERAGRKSAWIIVSAVFSPKDVAMAPVSIPEYKRHPEVLSLFGRDVYGAGDEFVIHSPREKLPVGKFKIISKTRSRRFQEAIDFLGDFLARS